MTMPQTFQKKAKDIDQPTEMEPGWLRAARDRLNTEEKKTKKRTKIPSVRPSPRLPSLPKEELSERGNTSEGLLERKDSSLRRPSQIIAESQAEEPRKRLLASKGSTDHSEIFFIHTAPKTIEKKSIGDKEKVESTLAEVKSALEKFTTDLNTLSTDQQVPKAPLAAKVQQLEADFKNEKLVRPSSADLAEASHVLQKMPHVEEVEDETHIEDNEETSIQEKKTEDETMKKVQALISKSRERMRAKREARIIKTQSRIHRTPRLSSFDDSVFSSSTSTSEASIAKSVAQSARMLSEFSDACQSLKQKIQAEQSTLEEKLRVELGLATPRTTSTAPQPTDSSSTPPKKHPVSRGDNREET